MSRYFTEIGFPVATGPASDDNNTTVDVTVMNAHAVAAYQFDTSLGGPSQGDCFGDQPKTGFDNNALVVSTDEYCGPTESNYEGAIVLTISKPQLVSEAATVADSVLGPVSLSGPAAPSEPYAFPVPATSTGDGSTHVYNGSGGKMTITSETALNPDDSRISGPVEVTLTGPGQSGRARRPGGPAPPGPGGCR